MDQWVKIEHQRLQYLRENQRQLRVDWYRGLHDHVQRRQNQQNQQNGGDAAAGVPIVLPSTHQDSPRNMQQRYQDAMAIVTKYGKPDYFITMTCNPQWPEIVRNLRPGQTALNAPHLVSRVFRQYLNAFISDLWENGVLGRGIARIHVIEFQKRGYPHAHILLTVRQEDKLRDAGDVDSVISAEIPNREELPLLWDTVSSSMMHGPCGADNPANVCMRGNECSKDFPKDFRDLTDVNVRGYPKYRRRQDGRTVEKRVPGRNEPVLLDNRFVIPYNPYLSQKFNCHINVEACMSIAAVKYLYKYIYKGHDRADVLIHEVWHHDEIQHYINTRYVSPGEAVWHIFSFPMQDKSHSVERLPVHTADFQQVVFEEGREEEALARAEGDTKLTGWFKLNQEDIRFRNVLYADIISTHSWDKNRKRWKRRRRNRPWTISRLVSVSPRDHERFHLRLLLLHVPGATGYDDLKTVNGVGHNTFKEACVARGLIAANQLWIDLVREAVASQMPKQLRRMFAYMLVFSNVNDPLQIWEEFRENFCEDYTHRGLGRDAAYLRGLGDILSVLRYNGYDLQAFNLPHQGVLVNGDMVDQMEAAIEADRAEPLLNEEQRRISEEVLNSVEEASLIAENNLIPGSARMYFVDAPGGTGKTFLFNQIRNRAVARGYKVKTAAWTGIAATLLKLGRTIHSTFKVPVPCNDGSSCSIAPNSEVGREMKGIDLFILDEASMISCPVLEAIDRCLRDITGLRNIPFGGKTFVLGGDFRQTLPIVATWVSRTTASKAQTFGMCASNITSSKT